MKVVTLDSEHLAGKVIDAHTHVGIGAAGYLAGSYPYCQSAESLLCRMDMHDVDCAVVFPFGEALMHDVCQALSRDKRVSAPSTPSGAPYAAENRLLCEEVYGKAPGAAERLLPFVNADPGRSVRRQLQQMEALAEEYPIYGIKVAGVAVHSSHKHLMGKAEGFVRFAEERGLAMLLHSTAFKRDRFCHNSINLAVAEKYPSVRFCLAHCLGFDKPDLDRADAMPNVWVDSAAMKIQVEASDIMAPPERRFASDYCDHLTVFSDLAHAYPKTMIWGSDSPAYSYITKRRYPDGSIVDFKLEGTYGMEAAVLHGLAESLQTQVASINARKFLFG